MNLTSRNEGKSNIEQSLMSYQISILNIKSLEENMSVKLLSKPRQKLKFFRKSEGEGFLPLSVYHC